MKKKKSKKESGASRMSRIKTKNERAKVIRDLCNRIVLLFDMPANQGLDGSEIELSNLLNKISPWQDFLRDDDDDFEKVWEGVKVSFGFGFALGQMLDLPEIDITPIKDLLREERALLYMPHEKKAA